MTFSKPPAAIQNNLVFILILTLLINPYFVPQAYAEEFHQFSADEYQGPPQTTPTVPAISKASAPSSATPQASSSNTTTPTTLQPTNPLSASTASTSGADRSQPLNNINPSFGPQFYADESQEPPQTTPTAPATQLSPATQPALQSQAQEQDPVSEAFEGALYILSIRLASVDDIPSPNGAIYYINENILPTLMDLIMDLTSDYDESGMRMRQLERLCLMVLQRAMAEVQKVDEGDIEVENLKEFYKLSSRVLRMLNEGLRR